MAATSETTGGDEHAPAPPVTRRVPLLAAALVGAVGVVGAALAGPWQRIASGPVEVPTPELPTVTPLEQATENAVLGEPPSGPVSLTMVLALVALVVLFFVLRALARRAILARGTTGGSYVSVPNPPPTVPQPAEPEPDLPALRRGAAAATEVLEGRADPTDAIVAAWLELEAAAASSGVPRAPADTPSEFTAAVLDATRADPQATRTLLGLYRRARFSPGVEMSAADVEEAGCCLTRLATSWEDR